MITGKWIGMGVGKRRIIVALLFVLATGVLLYGCALFSNLPPVIGVTASPTRGSIPLDVEFNAAASYDPDGRITQWGWDFADGETETGAIVSHRFSEPGTYVVELSVRDNRRTTSMATITIEVVEFNTPPVAVIMATPLQGQAPQLVSFNALGSTDEDGKIEEWSWDFGDGEKGTGSTVFHRYTKPGTYTVQLTVRDDLQATDSDSATIAIAESAPFLRRFQWDYSGNHFDWTVSIPSSLYYEYKGRLRGVWEQRDYDEYVLDPLDDTYLSGLVDWIQGQVGADFYATVECVFNFVQAAITYTYDRSGFEYPRYPLETLVDEIGDCEDTAILYASLVRTLGSGAMLAAVDTNHDGAADHMITLVPVSQAYADAVTCEHGCVSSFWTYGGQLYAFAETTGEPDLMGYYFELGCDPWGLTEIDFKITWDVASVTVDPKFEKWAPLHSE